MQNIMRLAQAETPESATEITCANFPPACFTNFSDVGSIALPIVYAIATFVVLGYGIHGAIKYIGAAGDAKVLEDARKIISFAVLGAIVIVLAFFITKLVGWLLDIDFLL